MIKIGIITYHRSCNNYGALLQAFALRKILEQKWNADVFFIDFFPPHLSGKQTPVLRRFFASSLMRTIKKQLNMFYSHRVYCKLLPFAKRSPLSHLCYKDFKQLQASPPDADVYIVGSDMVWNPEDRWSQTAFYLNFGAEKTIRLSYAVSTGGGKASQEQIERFKSCLSRFRQISVRDEWTRDHVASAGFSGTIVPDPVLLHNSAFYRKIESERLIKKPYIAVYILNQDQSVANSIVKELAYSSQKNILNVPLNYANRLNFSGVINKILTVEEWLSFINHSEFLITNSFHAVLFALLFQRDFIFIPIEGHGAKNNKRIYFILKFFQLQDRSVSNYDQFKQLSPISQEKWQDVQKRLAIFCNDGLSFLKKNIPVNDEN